MENLMVRNEAQPDKVAVRKSTNMVTRNNPQPLDQVYNQRFLVADEERVGKYADEVIGAIKDDRMLTKRSVSADIASTARVQAQNGAFIAVCERELRRRDLSEERREELVDMINDARQSSANSEAESRAFQQEQLDHLHKLPWRLLLVVGCVLIGGIGGTTLLRVAAN